MKPTSLTTLAKDLNLHLENDSLVRKVAIDSRKVEKGDLFFALPGNRVDGHDFLENAAKQGAVGAVVRKDYQGLPFGLPLLRVHDVLEALQELARKNLQRRRTKVVAITGSLGKTTTKRFVSTLLESSYRIFASPLSYNSQASLPVSILMTDESEEILILEMGMTHAGQIEKLVSIAPPDIAILTNVAAQHTCNFEDGLDGVKREKMSIFHHPNTKLSILPHDLGKIDPPAKTFSLVDRSADYYLEFIPDGVRIHSKYEDVVELMMHLPLKPYYQNFLIAVILARALGVSWHVIQGRAQFLKAPPMRFERIDIQGMIFINDAYNANPDSMKAALEDLPQGKRKIAVLSEMDALGIYSEEGHAIVAEAAFQHTDILLCIGKRCEAMCQFWKEKGKPAELFSTRDELEARLKKIVQPGDVILLKGARAFALDQILESFSSCLSARRQ